MQTEVRRVHCFTIDSTNEEALRLWNSQSAASPLVVNADVQTAGVGRHGRAWCSPPGGLWFSIAWPAPEDPACCHGLPLAVGSGVADVLTDRYSLPCQVKWPNDVLVRDRKLAGVLCRMELPASPPVLVVGVGINGNYRVDALATTLRQPATTLRDERGCDSDLAALLDALVTRLCDTLSDWGRGDARAWVNGVRRRLAWRGDTVRVVDAVRALDITGRLTDVTDSGALLIQVGGTMKAVTSGDVSRIA